MSFMINSDSIVTVIESYQRAEIATKVHSGIRHESATQWNALFDQVLDGVTSGEIKNSTDLDRAFKPGEDAYMEKYYAHDGNAKWGNTTPKHNAGDWKYSLLPNNYTSSVSILKRAVDNGLVISYVGKGKSALQKALPRTNKPRDVAGTLAQITHEITELRPYLTEGAWDKFLCDLDDI